MIKRFFKWLREILGWRYSPANVTFDKETDNTKESLVQEQEIKEPEEIELIATPYVKMNVKYVVHDDRNKKEKETQK